MGHSQADKVASHQRIVEITATRLRVDGLSRPAIGELMKEAGLTHGGFYRHFGSRDELVDESIVRALWDGARRIADAVGAERDSGGDPLAGLIAAYLSPEHRDDLAGSCAVATLGADVARASDRTRSAYGDQVRSYLRVIEGLLDEPDPAARRRRAVLTLSALVGAVIMARAVSDPELSGELLALVGDALTGP
ncbi:MAG: TetR/AcrR family transcriptional regulator, transcriptional repressor for nem operon [Pseudonocardiales bacterium]|nr:TetR/AcrR family transcriptional regulator, transcriptional repressor for nem operon [Pseudonocardiales bacterium]MDT7635037.1 TetR/AcrR family transcriptional regulator, transcriptional repressor for nem operon [Pseudonocardiales bacterium]MDT7638153.1 TetR/AcrR family transcriptional regulator, transcriptional repressor for nem operon [Pseudonocardiales bacterium]MDT7644845.1 TetR/AcrR family transcriptional regulator, transcriptional repressor for nem operon [Pseudonocardiales bacterium]M